jgi:2-pyrone-4,6-dicarboxylate lactonase
LSSVLRESEPASAAFKLPRNACDTHCHVFGPHDRFPFVANRKYTPSDTPKEAVAAKHESLGVERAVIVQASIHGTDNGAMVEMLRWRPKNYRGVAMIDDATSERDLQALHEAGVRGIRFNFNRNLGGFPDLDLVKRSVARVRELGWHLVMQIDGKDANVLSPLIRALPIPFVIDHMGRCDADAGIAQPDFKVLLELMRVEGAWIKLTCPERMTRRPYDAAVPFARALIEARRDRVLWGTDFPHPNLPDPVDDHELVGFVPRYAFTAAEQQALLVDNPARLYGFHD